MNNFESDEQRKAVMSKLNGSKKVGSNDIEIDIKIPATNQNNKMIVGDKQHSKTNWKQHKEFYNIEKTGYVSGSKTRFLTWDEVEEIYELIESQESHHDALEFLNGIKKEKAYPDSLSLDEFDDIPWDKTKQFGLNSDANIEKIKEYAKKINGQIYTQVDGDNDRVYSKGLRFVNRTGMYEVVKLGDNKADNS